MLNLNTIERGSTKYDPVQIFLNLILAHFLSYSFCATRAYIYVHSRDLQGGWVGSLTAAQSEKTKSESRQCTQRVLSAELLYPNILLSSIHNFCVTRIHFFDHRRRWYLGGRRLRAITAVSSGAHRLPLHLSSVASIAAHPSLQHLAFGAQVRSIT